MKPAEVLRRRLASSLLGDGARSTAAADVVTHLGAVQAQDFTQSLWALGCRTSRSDSTALEAEIAAGALVRTWPMRGTLHWVRPADVRWMLDLTAPRVAAAVSGRHRQLGLGAADLGRAEDVVLDALAAGPQTRPTLFAALAAGGVSPEGQRGIHLLSHLARRGMLVMGARLGKQASYQLLDTPPSTLDREAALAKIAYRYVRGHGPATARDLAWWTGLTLVECRQAVAGLGDRVERVDIEGETHAFVPRAAPANTETVLLLAGFDEHVLAYADRSAVLGVVPLERVVPGRNGMFLPTVVRAGRVVGTWRAASDEVTWFEDPVDTGPARRRYQRFREGAPGRKQA